MARGGDDDQLAIARWQRRRRTERRRDPHAWPHLLDGFEAAHVIRMSVRDEHASERSTGERPGDACDVSRHPGTRVDECRLATGEQPGIVAGGAGPLGRISSGYEVR